MVRCLILLNALITHSDEPFILITKPLKPKEAIWKINLSECIESYIGHEATAKLLEKLTSRPIAVNRAMYSPRNGDLAVIVRLRKRLEKVEDVKNVTESDIEFIEVRYIAGYEVPLEIDENFNVRYITR
jgi:hypothetical protein